MLTYEYTEYYACSIIKIWVLKQQVRGLSFLGFEKAVASGSWGGVSRKLHVLKRKEMEP